MNRIPLFHHQIGLILILLLFVIATGGCSQCNRTNKPFPADRGGLKSSYPATVKDIDGNAYHPITIGKQVWLTENLRVTHFQNGEAIPEAKNKTEWKNLKSASRCNLDNDPSMAAVYGSLYNWYAVDDKRNICPKGWHVPSENEWSELTNFLGGEAIAGGKMKNQGHDRWAWPNSGATNESGFNAIPNGYRSNLGTFYPLDTYTFFWTSTGYSGDCALSKFLQNDYDGVTTIENDHAFGFSVRCIRDGN
ncbi:MAG: fibrobacter succinogenes major paralogous domain-containing protein [Bacteroidales bacterium]|nr:fibrobacter succinogenes major paralogous domain-containing protein [Bacteroidales bacterium]